MNEGSKLVIAAAGSAIRQLSTEINRCRFRRTLVPVRVCLPGVLVVKGPVIQGTPGPVRRQSHGSANILIGRSHQPISVRGCGR